MNEYSNDMLRAEVQRNKNDIKFILFLRYKYGRDVIEKRVF
jgi:hypothetical protein